MNLRSLHISLTLSLCLWFSLVTGARLGASSLTSRATCSSAGGLCGVASNGVPCCPGLTCTNSDVCAGCATVGSLCGVPANGVPCCDGLFCTNSGSCHACGAVGSLCGVPANGVPCCTGLFCSSTNTCTQI
ncbi:hypothetical protein LshimejAT787_0201730 [Lyophyllum shimeji]|uniref:Uncharacterized protein n=1 Tax=Lyophyllum shimeji TaxID=47721 RepID=A0A9P3PFR4_LYOSH|nr:hypothetical protein LshimejAT787_0201730 [Lyophyllum shimeji]